MLLFQQNTGICTMLGQKGWLYAPLSHFVQQFCAPTDLLESASPVRLKLNLNFLFKVQ
jgi:hypothetical protein